MSRVITRAALVGLASAAVAVIALFAAYSMRARLRLEMDRPLQRTVMRGIYEPERADALTFAWTDARAQLTLRDLRRSQPWTCSVRLRGPGINGTFPTVTIEVDGLPATTAQSSGEFQDIPVDVPLRPGRDGVTLTITSSATVVPGGGDPRQLGVQLDAIECAPAGPLAMPPLPAIGYTALAAAVLGTAVGLCGLPLGATAAALLLLSAGQAWLVANGTAPYDGFATRMLPFAAWLALLMAAIVQGARQLRRVPLSSAGAAVIAFSCIALYLKLGAALHPSKLVIDAVFHAHRFEWVVAGRYLFTQGMPGGVSFPYAIGFYLVASPLGGFFRDHVALLRVVLGTSEVLAGALLYPLVAIAWRDRAAAVAAVLLFHLVPLPYELIGNANMTNAFGQSAALYALVAAVLCPPDWRRPWSLLLLFGLAALAFLSHVSTFSLLVLTIGVTGMAWFVAGEPGTRAKAPALLAVGAAAAIFAVAVYYGHFMEVYRTAWRARVAASVSAPASPGTAPAPAAPTPPIVPIGTRAQNALALTASAIGWPILLLAAVGGWRLLAERKRDRLAGLIVGWTAAYAAFLLVALMRVDAPFQRYAAEFVGRVVLATYPAAVILAAAGVVWSWRAGLVSRVAMLAVVAWAVRIGVSSWTGWFA